MRYALIFALAYSVGFLSGLFIEKPKEEPVITAAIGTTTTTSTTTVEPTGETAIAIVPLDEGGREVGDCVQAEGWEPVWKLVQKGKRSWMAKCVIKKDGPWDVGETEAWGHYSVSRWIKVKCPS